MDISDLMKAAATHINNSLTPHNVAEEIASTFSRTFPTMQKQQERYLRSVWVRSHRELTRGFVDQRFTQSESSTSHSFKQLFEQMFDHQATADVWLGIFKDLRITEVKKGKKST